MQLEAGEVAKRIEYCKLLYISVLSEHCRGASHEGASRVPAG